MIFQKKKVSFIETKINYFPKDTVSDYRNEWKPDWGLISEMFFLILIVD